jgi:hypothetical protein
MTPPEWWQRRCDRRAVRKWLRSATYPEPLPSGVSYLLPPPARPVCWDAVLCAASTCRFQFDRAPASAPEVLVFTSR